MPATAQQSTEVKSSTLEGFSEGVIADGHVVLKIWHKSLMTAVVGMRLGDEDALAFPVMHWHGLMPSDRGLLYVTKTRIAFIPEGNKEHAFNVSRSEVKEAKASSKRFPINLGHYLLVDAAGGEKRFAVLYTGKLRGPSFDYLDLVSDFFDRAVTSFDAALNEFDQRTAAVMREAERVATEAKAKAEEERERGVREAAEAKARAAIYERETKQTIAEIRQRETIDSVRATERFNQSLGGPSFGLTAKGAASTQNALKSLRRLAGATEIGVIRTEYSSRLIDVKSDVDEASAGLPEGALRDELQLALRAFVDANGAWNEMVDRDYLGTGYDPGMTFQARYTISTDQELNIIRGRKRVLSVIWQSAREHLDRASKLLEHHSP